MSVLDDPLLELLRDTAEDSGYIVKRDQCRAFGLIREIVLANNIRIQIYPIGGIHKLSFRDKSNTRQLSETQLYSLGSLDIELRRGLRKI